MAQWVFQLLNVKSNAIKRLYLRARRYTQL